ncbi:MAG: T9SS type A sorting domain-containing protein [Sphingobacteriales bacterium]|nr:MAG: T9SS type A sorting domain-containing protein [Sphingobacteriales bacterium]
MKSIPHLIYLFAFLCHTAIVYGQTDNFETSIDPDDGLGSNNGINVNVMSDGLIVTSASLCFGNSVPCSDIVKTDWGGNVLWHVQFEDYPDAFSAHRSGTIVNDEDVFLMAGKTVNDNRQFTISVLDNAGNNVWYAEYGSEFDEMGSGGLISVENNKMLSLCSSGTNWVFSKAMITKINNNGEVQWQKVYSIDTFTFTIAKHLALSANGDYLFTVETPLPPPDIGYKKTLAHVFATDTAGNQKWQFALNETWDGQCAAFIAPLPNGNLAVSWCNDTLIGAWGQNYGIPHYVAGMDTAGNMLWQHYFTAPYIKQIYRLRKTSNGDIIGCGGLNYAGQYDGGWMFRISAAGELLWQREYVHHLPGYGNNAGIAFMDLTETPDGGIAATGPVIQRNENGQLEIDIWLVKTDADGCMEPGCNNGLIWLSADEAAEGVWIGRELNALHVYPNPASSQITVRLPNNAVAYTPAQIDVYNIHGQRVHSHPLLPGQRVAQIDLPTLPEGIYIVHLKGHKNLSAKLVIE